MRSGTETTWRALRYSGFFWKRVEFSRVEASSVREWISSAFPKNHLPRMPRWQNDLEGQRGMEGQNVRPVEHRVKGEKKNQWVILTYPCRPARTRARREGSGRSLWRVFFVVCSAFNLGYIVGKEIGACDQMKRCN